MPKRAAEEVDTTDTSKKAKIDDDAAGAELQEDEEGNSYLDLGNKKRVSVSVFKGKPLVNIREFYTDKSGELKPGKKGITLNPAQWETLVSNVVSLNEKVKAMADGTGQDEGETRKEKPAAAAKTSGKATESKKGGKKPSKKKKEDTQSDEDESD